MTNPKQDVVVGVSCLGHDAAVSAIDNEQILFASQAERYSGKKNDKYLNNDIINDLENYISGVKSIGFYERPFLKCSRQIFSGQYQKALFSSSPRSYLKQFQLIRKSPLHYVQHHLSHACAGYFTSPFRDAAIVVVDAIGEWETLTVWYAKDRALSRIISIKYPNSLGLLYSAFTQRTGFKPNEEEYIMMGLASFGQPIYADIIRKDFIKELPAPFFFQLKRNVHRGIRSWRPDLNDIENIAASCQKIVEDYLLSLFQWVATNVPSTNLVYGGGVALNCVLNEKLARKSFFKNIWILPDPGDAGSSIGAALAIQKTWVEWRGPYLGHDIKRSFDIERALACLLKGEVIGIANGRAEFGPRALGNRSLIADPRGFTVKERVNKIKKRELFRPFAPVVLEEYANAFFDLPCSPSPYMQFIAPCKCPHEIPAVCHVDGTSRVQTIRYDQNQNFYCLIRKFYEATGCPVLLNTSLNVKGKPLVNSWKDAEAFKNIHDIAVF